MTGHVKRAPGVRVRKTGAHVESDMLPLDAVFSADVIHALAVLLSVILH